jgi:hypothetical protein
MRRRAFAPSRGLGSRFARYPISPKSHVGGGFVVPLPKHPHHGTSGKKRGRHRSSAGQAARLRSNGRPASPRRLIVQPGPAGALGHRPGSPRDCGGSQHSTVRSDCPLGIGIDAQHSAAYRIGAPRSQPSVSLHLSAFRLEAARLPPPRFTHQRASRGLPLTLGCPTGRCRLSPSR